MTFHKYRLERILRKGPRLIITHTCALYIWALVCLHDVFSVFDPSVQVSMKTTTSVVERISLHDTYSVSYSVVNLQVSTELYLDFQYFAF